jgi:glucose/arabinose dehydrogenase
MAFGYRRVAAIAAVTLLGIAAAYGLRLLFVGALAGRHLRRVVLEGETVVHEEQLLRGRRERIRDVRQGPDGLLYLVTDEEAGALLRLEPADTPDVRRLG